MLSFDSEMPKQSDNTLSFLESGFTPLKECNKSGLQKSAFVDSVFFHSKCNRTVDDVVVLGDLINLDTSKMESPTTRKSLTNSLSRNNTIFSEKGEENDPDIKCRNSTIFSERDSALRNTSVSDDKMSSRIPSPVVNKGVRRSEGTDSLRMKDKEIQRLKKLIVHLTAENREPLELLSRLQKYSDEQADDTKELQELHRREMQIVEEERNELKQEIEKIAAQVNASLSKLDILQKERDEANRQCEQQFLEIHDLNRKLRKMGNVERSREVVQEELETLRKEHEELKLEYASRKNQPVESISDDLCKRDAVTMSDVSCQTYIPDERKEISDSQENLAMKVEIASLKEENMLLKKQLEIKESALVSVKEQCEEITAAATEQRIFAEQSFQQKSEEIDALKERLSKLTEEIRDSELRCLELTEALIASTKDVDLHKRVFDEMQQEKHALVQQLEDLHNKCKANENLIADLEEINERLGKACDSADEEESRYRAEIDSRDRRIQELELLNSQILSTKKKLEQKLAALTSTKPEKAPLSNSENIVPTGSDMISTYQIYAYESEKYKLQKAITQMQRELEEVRKQNLILQSRGPYCP